MDRLERGCIEVLGIGAIWRAYIVRLQAANSRAQATISSDCRASMRGRMTMRATCVAKARPISGLPRY